MRKLINLVTGSIVALAPILIAGILGIFIYNELPNIVGILICIVLGVSAGWLGIIIFKKVQKMGIIDFVTVVNASPELDNLEPTEGSNTWKRTPKELAENFSKKIALFKGGTIKIFGDWHGEPYQNYREIKSIDFYEQQNRLVISFSESTRVIIDGPGHVLESPTVLKILSAKEVKLELINENKDSITTESIFKKYTVAKNKIHTETNIEQGIQKIDASHGQDALIVFG